MGDLEVQVEVDALPERFLFRIAPPFYGGDVIKFDRVAKTLL